MKLPALVVMFLSTAVSAADQRPEDVLTLLGSEVASERAWGAHRAGNEGVKEAVPRLVDLIRTVPEREDEEEQLIVRAAFDALIRLEARPQPKVLEPHLKSRLRTPALILFVPDAGDHPGILLQRFDAQQGKDLGPFGIALGNLLLRHRGPGFASRLLRGLEFELSVMVLDAGFGGRGSTDRFLARSGDGRLDVPEGFPPTVIYQLTTEKEDGAVLLVDGPRKVYWTRMERTGTKIGFGSTTRPRSRQTLAREWLYRLADVPAKAALLRAFSSMSIAWSDADVYQKEVTERRNEILADYWKLVSALVTKEVITLDEARALKPRVEIEVTDKREFEDELPAIPEPPERPKLPGERTAR